MQSEYRRGVNDALRAAQVAVRRIEAPEGTTGTGLQLYALTDALDAIQELLTAAPLNFAAAIRAAAPNAPGDAIDALGSLPEISTPLRAAHLIGQCSYESGGFRRVKENLTYTAKRLMEVWAGRFPSMAIAKEYERSPVKLANFTYGGRLGNTEPNDGWDYRGRGYIQLTGKSNYRIFGKRIGVDLVAEPWQAAEPETAWKIAVAYLTTRSRKGKTALEWADENNVEMVTRIVNGGTNGLADRRRLTEAALAAL